MPPAKQPPEFDPERTGISLLLGQFDARMERIEQAVSALVRIEVQQVDQGKALERSFGKIESLERDIAELREEVRRWVVIRQLVGWVGLPGVAAIAYGLFQMGRMAGAG